MSTTYLYDGAMGADGATGATDVRWLTAEEQQAWRGLLDMEAKLDLRLNREMVASAGISLPDFAVLVQLSEHVDGEMRVLELARALGWEKSRLSHHLNRMQQRGLIERRVCPSDRRGAVVALAEAGRRTIETAAPLHVESVRKYVFDVLSRAQVTALAALTGAVVAGLDATCAAMAPAGPEGDLSDLEPCD